MITKRFAEVNGVRMAYVEQGTGDPIVFQHGNPTSSYLWRNIMPRLEGLGRLIACDLAGMGDSGPLDHYGYTEQRDQLFALWEHLGRRPTLSWPHQTEVTVPGLHFVQEDSPDLIGAAVAAFVRGVARPPRSR